MADSNQIPLDTHHLAVEATQLLDLTYCVRVYPKSGSAPPLFTFTKVLHCERSGDKTTLLLLLPTRKFAVFFGHTYMMFRPMRGDTSATFRVSQWPAVQGGFAVHSNLFQHHYYVQPARQKVIVSNKELHGDERLDQMYAIRMLPIVQGDRMGLSEASQRYLLEPTGGDCCTIT